MDGIVSRRLKPRCCATILFLAAMLFISTVLLSRSRSNGTLDIFSLKKWGRNRVPDPEAVAYQRPKINSKRFVVRGPACRKDSVYLKIKKAVKPPAISSTQFAQELQHFWRYVAANQTSLASHELSTIVQKQISQIQEKGCDGSNLQCGHQTNKCGFGCQMHHRIACLMMSYVTNLPLIHTPDCDGWGHWYFAKWTDLFQPLGSKCTPGNRTIVWSWNKTAPLALKDCRSPKGDVRLGSRIPYPLQYGIPLAPELADMIQTLTPDPFLWIVGQFTKYVMKWNPTFVETVQNSKSQIGFSNSGNGTPIVGIHVRRTDKIVEYKKSVHPTTVYMDEVETYFHRLEVSQGLKNNSLKRRVFVASESKSIVKECRKKHPDWEILGFESKYSEAVSSRRDGLFEIARDVSLLSQSDFVICGFSSNMCRLVHEMQTYVRGMDLEGSRPRGNDQQLSQLRTRVKSVDGRFKYIYALWNHSLNMRIYTIDC